MPSQPDPLYDHVRPGDLIAAEKFNKLLDKLSALETQINNLQGTHGDAPVITALSPGPYTVGSLLTIDGMNFDVSIGGSFIVFDNQTARLPNAGSKDTQLLFTIPPINNLPSAGKTVDLVIRNHVSETARTILIQRDLVPLDDTLPVSIEWRNIDPAIIEPQSNTPLQFSYRARSFTNRKATFTIQPRVDVPAGSKIKAEQIQKAFTIRNPDGDEIKSLELDPSVHDFISFVMQLDKPANLALEDKMMFALHAELTAEGKSWSSGNKAFVVGQKNILPDDSITLTVGFVDPGKVDTKTNTIHIPAQTNASLHLSAVFTQVGNYTLLLPEDADKWKIARSPLTLSVESVTEAQLKQAKGTVIRSPALSIDSPNSGTTEIVVGYQGEGRETNQTTALTLTVG